MVKAMLMIVPATMLLVGFAPADDVSSGDSMCALKCHSEQYNLAKRKLNRLTLTRAQKRAILTYERRFWNKWRRTHRRHGCSHHEAHAYEFVAAAAGVLTDAQFRRFQGRERDRFEAVGHRIWRTRQYVSNLVKIAESL